MGNIKSLLPKNRQTIEQLITKFKEDTSYYVEWKGPVCDSTGFFQHFGECWSDSIQMCMLYSDGLKEITQPYFYNAEPDFEQIVATIRQIVKEFGFSEESEDEIKTMSELALIYLNILKRRFRRHYSTEIQRREIIPECALDEEKLKDILEKLEIIEMKGRAQGANAVGTAHYSKQLFDPMVDQYTITKLNRLIRETRGNNELLGKSYDAVKLPSVEYRDVLIQQYEKNPGGKKHTQLAVISLIASVCGISMIMDSAQTHVSNNQLLYKQVDIFNEPDDKLIIAENFKLLVGASFIQLSTKNHSMSFYSCGGMEYYYENNWGPVPFNWKEFIAQYFIRLADDENPEIRFGIYEIRSKLGKYRHGFYPYIVCKDKIWTIRGGGIIGIEKHLVDGMIDYTQILQTFIPFQLVGGPSNIANVGHKYIPSVLRIKNTTRQFRGGKTLRRRRDKQRTRRLRR